MGVRCGDRWPNPVRAFIGVVHVMAPYSGSRYIVNLYTGSRRTSVTCLVRWVKQRAHAYLRGAERTDEGPASAAVPIACPKEAAWDVSERH
jgi:hypothetical protein